MNSSRSRRFDQLLFWLFKKPETSGVAGGLTPGWKSVRLDKVGSVSGSDLMETDWDDAAIEDQQLRFLNGVDV